MAERINILGIEIDNLSMPQVLQRIDSFVRSGRSHVIVTPNVDHLVKLQKDAHFRHVYRIASLALPDGQLVIWASRFLGTPLSHKVSGSDLLPRLCRHAAARGHTLFFLGGRPGAAMLAARKLQEQNPTLVIAGIYCPPYGFEHDARENGKIIRMIRDARPDIVLVGLGAPKQEKWVSAHMTEYDAPVSIGIGASFEFASETIRRAPRWMQSAGLEWMCRLIREPRRLWKRYLVDDMAFFHLVLKQKRFGPPTC